MPIEPISGINQPIGLDASGGLGKAGPSASPFEGFSKMLGSAINNLNRTEQAANQAVARVAAGEDVELHQVMIAMQEADISLQLALQVRNKLVEAYSEVMRMQV